MNGIRKKSIPQEVFEYEYNHCVSVDEDIKDVENFYRQYERSDAYRRDIRVVKGY